MLILSLNIISSTMHHSLNNAVCFSVVCEWLSSSQIWAVCSGFIKHVGYWVGRQICPSHRGLDIISLCFPQWAQPTQCTPQDCRVKQTEKAEVRRGRWQADEDERGREGDGNIPVYVDSLDSSPASVSLLCVCVWRETATWAADEKYHLRPSFFLLFFFHLSLFGIVCKFYLSLNAHYILIIFPLSGSLFNYRISLYFYQCHRACVAVTAFDVLLIFLRKHDNEIDLLFTFVTS